MDGVLEGAAVLCVCKLACSLFFLPSLADSRSPVSFCCCCLLIFTDFLVTVFLSFLHIFESWLSDLTPLGDVIALRFLLFLSHTYGVVLLLTTPLIAVETLSRLLGHHSVVSHRTAGQTATDLDRQRCYVGEAAVEKEVEDGDNPDKDTAKGLSHVVGYLCCLSVWVLVALNVRWRWKVEEVWAAACMHTTNSLIRCLPNLFSPMSSTMNPCWVMAFLSMLLLLLTIATGLHRQHGATTQTTSTQTEKCGININRYWQDLAAELPAPSKPVISGTPASWAAQSVDPEKTESSCSVHRMCSGNGVQMSRSHHGNFILVSPECLSAGQERGPTRRGIALTFLYSSSMEDHVDSQHRSQSGWRQWGFPRPGVNVMIGFVGVLSIFVLPLNLSVNILLIRTIETLLEVCIKSLVSSTANTSNTPFSNSETLA